MAADRIHIKAPPESKDRWTAAASARGMTLSAWMRLILDAAASPTGCAGDAVYAVYRSFDPPGEYEAVMVSQWREAGV